MDRVALLFLFFVFLSTTCDAQFTLSWTRTAQNASSACPGWSVCQFFVTSSPSVTDRIVACDVSYFHTDGSLYNAASSQNTAPTQSSALLNPALLCDSYVDLGYIVAPDIANDCTTTTPDFSLTASVFTGGWYCSNPSSPQLNQSQGNNFFVAQLTVPSSASVGVVLLLYDSQGQVYQQGSTCSPSSSPPPFTLPPSSTTTTTISTSASMISTSASQSTMSTSSSSSSSMTTSTSSSSSNDAGLIAGVVIGVLAAVTIAIIVTVVLVKKYRTPSSSASSSELTHRPQQRESTQQLANGDDALSPVDFL